MTLQPITDVGHPDEPLCPVCCAALNALIEYGDDDVPASDHTTLWCERCGWEQDSENDDESNARYQDDDLNP